MYPIEIKDVFKSFGETKVLREINLKLNEKIILGLIGHFGVEIKITLEMESTDAGKALIFGIKIPNRKLLRRIGYIASSDALYLDLIGKENLEFFAQIKEINPGTKFERVINYYGGMMRRLSLAIALLGDPAEKLK